jgi:hypothetical protein
VSGASGAGPDLPPAEQVQAQADPPPVPAVSLDDEQQGRVAESQVALFEIRAKQAGDDRELRKTIADKVFKAAVVQVVIADVVFVLYGFWNGWEIPGSTMNAWLAATVAQIAAVALVIARSLFPARDP